MPRNTKMVCLLTHAKTWPPFRDAAEAVPHPSYCIMAANRHPCYWPSGPPLSGPGNWAEIVERAKALDPKADIPVSYGLAKLADFCHRSPPLDGHLLLTTGRCCYFCRVPKDGAFIDQLRRCWLCNNCQWWTNKELEALRCKLDDL